jgi:hypothetical protein
MDDVHNMDDDTERMEIESAVPTYGHGGSGSNSGPVMPTYGHGGSGPVMPTYGHGGSGPAGLVDMTVYKHRDSEPSPERDRSESNRVCMAEGAITERIESGISKRDLHRQRMWAKKDNSWQQPLRTKEGPQRNCSDIGMLKRSIVESAPMRTFRKLPMSGLSHNTASQVRTITSVLGSISIDSHPLAGSSSTPQ